MTFTSMQIIFSSPLDTDRPKDHALEGWIPDKLDDLKGLRFLQQTWKWKLWSRTCSSVLFIIVMSCENGASDFNVVIYVECLAQCILDCISSQRAHISPPPIFVRGGVKSLLTLWPCRGGAAWSELTNCWMPIKGQSMAHLHLLSLGSLCWCCHVCAFCSEKT